METQCVDCGLYVERIYMEPVYSIDSERFIWLCPDCLDAVIANEESQP